jgi:UDP-glucose 4-epimerase
VKFLITGSSGFVGKRLLNAIDDNIVLLSRKKNSLFPTIVCDFEKDEIPSFAFESVDVVIHLAGVAHDFGDASIQEDYYRKINVDTSVNLAILASQNNVKRFVFISSVKAGGSEITESSCVNHELGSPEGIYGRSKREAEIKLLKIGRKSGMSVSIIRPSLVYGPEVKGNLKLMLSGIKKGWFPPLPETRNRRSMIHVDDLVRVILLVSVDRRANGEIFIATDGSPYSSREIYNAMCVVIGKSITKWAVPKMLFNLASLLSPSMKYKINKLLGDEFYPSDKLEALGFRANKSLKDMNETDF